MLKLALAWWREVWQDGLPARSAFALLFALACVAIATLVRIGLGAISPGSAMFAPYYSATLVAALIGGAAAGGVAAAAGAIAAFLLFVPPDWKSHAFDIEQIVNYCLFAGSSFVIVWAANSYRALLRCLREERERRQLFNRELAHRIRNALSSVQAIANQTLRDHPAALAKLSGRIAALAATNDLLIETEWRGARMQEIIAGEFAPYEPSRFRVTGEDFECPAEAATILALIFHELTTNAAKYGALSAPQGRVELSWNRRDDGRVEFDWIEIGGPAPQQSRGEGFGTTLLRRSLQQFDGEVAIEFAPGGLQCRLSLSLPPARPASEPECAAGPVRTCSTAVSAASIGRSDG